MIKINDENVKMIKNDKINVPFLYFLKTSENV